MADRKPIPAENERAFLKLLRLSEFGRIDDADYYTLYGFGKFEDDSTHPDKSFVVGKHKDGTPIFTTAAGAYQIVASTYRDAVKQGVASDFKPASQDKIALWLISSHKALDAVGAGHLATAVQKLRTTWVSLPGGSGQKFTLSQAQVQFKLLVQQEMQAGK